MGCENSKPAVQEVHIEDGKPPPRRRRNTIVRFFRAVFIGHEKSTRSERSRKLDLKQIAAHEYCCKDSVIGQGTFGVVYKACGIQKPDEIVAVKRIELDDERETREVDIHKLCKHRNVVALKQNWSKSVYKNYGRKTHVYMVMEYLPKTLEEVIQDASKAYKTMPMLMIKVCTYQMFRALNYLHKRRILHRDVKPSNLLVDMDTGVLKMCDFGCAKRITHPSGRNRTYICSRYYRAPELVLLNAKNDENIDVWAAACVLAECFRGWPLFPGKSTAHQFGAIADVLGNPTPEEIWYLNPMVKQMNVKVRDSSGTFDEHFPPGTPELGLDLLARMLVYIPSDRVPPLHACADKYYDQLRLNANTLVLPSGSRLPPLFDFSAQELKNAPRNVVERLSPAKHGPGGDFIYSELTPSPAPSIASAKRLAAIESIVSDADVEIVDEVYSELESVDVEDVDLWDCRKVKVVNTVQVFEL